MEPLPSLADRIDYQEELKSHFFDLCLDLLCILDRQGIIQQANRAFLTLLGSSSGETEGSFFPDLAFSDDISDIASAIDSLADNPISAVCRYRSFDETIKWYLWTFYPAAHDLVQAVGRDITPYKEMENRETERNIFAEALLDTVLAINSILALDQVLERILSNAGKVVAYEYVTILLVEADQAVVVGIHDMAQERPVNMDVDGQRFPIIESRYLHHMYETQESVIVPEIAYSLVWIGEKESAALGSFLGAPIVVEGEVIGFLCVFNKNKEFFTPLHAQQLITFANQAGLAINNARLYEQAQSAAILRERQRMAQELHDSVNQDLFAASTYADLLPKAIERRPQAVTEYARDISKLIRGAVDQMRMILIELHPDALTTTGLEVLLQQLCDVFQRQSGLPLNLNISNTKIIVEEKVQIAVYRIAQEALHNVDKHANATQVDVTFQLSHRDFYLSIEDNGTGFDQDAITDVQFGISGMKERAQAIHADLLITSSIGHGTKIELGKIEDAQQKSNSDYSGRRS